MKRFFLLAVIFGIIAFGCAEKKAIAPIEQSQEIGQPQTKAPEETGKTPEQITEQQAKVESEDVTSQMREISGLFKDIYFDYDRYDVREEARPILTAVADYLRKNPAQKLLIEGHCDERGTSEYNLALGDKRAKAVKDYLVSLGVSSSRIDTISYGKEKPVCAEHTDVCWAKNRRAHFVIRKGR
ncbi:MAG: peptidoglycan-associated lipoprotein Pal [Nitrospirae bacterium]|nr:peptidoglycan-associated lipoprotein Pal [Nitrospirota bacterium]